MAYADFLRAFAKLQGYPNEQVLLDQAPKFSFQIGSRDRAREWINQIAPAIGKPLSGLKVLDVGCSYGATAVELAKLGAKVAAIDVNAKWLDLAQQNARNEADVAFIKVNASARAMVRELQEHGPFDVVILRDVLQYIYDIAAVFDNLSRLINPDAKVFFRLPNGRSIKSVLSDPQQSKFGIALLPNEAWPSFGAASPNFYVRRWEVYRALFQTFGYETATTTKISDPDDEATRRHIVRGLRTIRKGLRPENFDTPEQLTIVRTAFKSYEDEVKDDLTELDWDTLFYKYRSPVWEGMLTHHAAADGKQANGKPRAQVATS